MDEFFVVVKIVAIIQVILVALLLLFAYSIKIYAHYKRQRCIRITHNIEQFFHRAIHSTHPFNPNTLFRYENETVILIDVVNKIDQSNPAEKWQEIRKKLMELIILPNARINAVSNNWYKRYIACLAFKLSLDEQDKNQIKTLITDPISLVSINAAMLAVKYNSQDMMDTVIDYFSKNRRVHQLLFSQVILTADETIIPLIKHRIKHENNAYIKAFCYHILASIPFVSETIETASSDIDSDTLNLKLGVLAYLVHNDPKAARALLTRFLYNPRWEVRAKAAKLIGRTHDDSFISALEPCLSDPEWWVRINVATALAALGPSGILILQKQTSEIDQYAYDAANNVLSTLPKAQ